MKKILLLLLILLVGACAHKSVPQSEGHGHGHGHSHGSAAVQKPRSTPPATPKKPDPSLTGRVYTLSSYYAASVEDLQNLNKALREKDDAAVGSMVAEKKAFMSPRLSSIVVEEVIPGESLDAVIRFRFLQKSESGFTFKSYLYEFQPDSI